MCFLQEVNMGNNRPKHTFENRGDTLEVRIRDPYGEYYHKAKALINSKKQMKALIDDLRNKGVTFPVGWFD